MPSVKKMAPGVDPADAERVSQEAAGVLKEREVPDRKLTREPDHISPEMVDDMRRAAVYDAFRRAQPDGRVFADYVTDLIKGREDEPSTVNLRELSKALKAPGNADEFRRTGEGDMPFFSVPRIEYWPKGSPDYEKLREARWNRPETRRIITILQETAKQNGTGRLTPEEVLDALGQYNIDVPADDLVLALDLAQERGLILGK